MRNQGGSLRISLAAVLLAGLFVAAGSAVANPSATSHAFVAQGSAEQVYVTGAAPGARMALLNRSGHQVATKAADSLGGLIFYGVPPGTGYRVRLLPKGPESGPVTVHSQQSAPWDPKVYDQSIPDQGYGYLTTRDGT